MTTFSGTVPISELSDFDTGSSYPRVSFEPTIEVVELGVQPNVTTEATFIETSAYFSGGVSEVVIFDTVTDVVADVIPVPNVHTEVTIINPATDFTFAKHQSGNQAVVINFGFGSNFTYVPVPRVNARIFPTTVELSTLFPGDVPRGSSLN